jgi:alpha-glucosidase
MRQAGWPAIAHGLNRLARQEGVDLRHGQIGYWAIMIKVGSEQAKVAAMLLLTLRGTPTIYYGDEIGLENVPIAPAQIQDPFEKNVPGLGLGRDGSRTPMQWDATQNAGFSLGSPWLPLSDDFESRNVSSLRQDHASIFNLHCRLLVIRRQRLSLSLGTYEPIAATGDLSQQ